MLLGEAMCTAAIDLGPEMSRTQLYAEAEKRFTTAIAAAHAANNAAMLTRRASGARVRGSTRESSPRRAPTPRSSRDNFVLNASYPATSRGARISGHRCIAGCSPRWIRASRRHLGRRADPRVTVMDAGLKGWIP